MEYLAGNLETLGSRRSREASGVRGESESGTSVGGASSLTAASGALSDSLSRVKALPGGGMCSPRWGQRRVQHPSSGTVSSIPSAPRRCVESSYGAGDRLLARLGTLAAAGPGQCRAGGRIAERMIARRKLRGAQCSDIDCDEPEGARSGFLTGLRSAGRARGAPGSPPAV